MESIFYGSYSEESMGSICFSIQLPSSRSVLHMGGTASSWRNAAIAAIAARGSSPPPSISVCVS